MPSSNKTPHLGLNRWLGSDKPKKDDFNEDNGRLDTAWGELSERVDNLSAGGGDGLAAHLADGDIHVNGEEKVAIAGIAGLLAHAADGAVHVTEEEKAAWGSGGGEGGAPLVDTYVGNGLPTRKLELGFAPSYGFLFAVNRGALEADWTGSESMVFSGFFSVRGSSRFLQVTETGLTATHNATRPGNGCSYKYNETDVTYVYVAWR